MASPSKCPCVGAWTWLETSFKASPALPSQAGGANGTWSVSDNLFLGPIGYDGISMVALEVPMCRVTVNEFSDIDGSGIAVEGTAKGQISPPATTSS